MDYWEECITEALEDAQIIATSQQIDIIASWVESSHENYGMAFGHDCISNPIEEENKKLKQKLEIEERKVVCDNCKGNGRITEYWLTRSSNSECYKCRGEGKVDPFK